MRYFGCEHYAILRRCLADSANASREQDIKKLSSSISFSNLMSPQMMMQYAEDYQIQNGRQWKGKENEMLLARQPTPQTLSRVISGKQGMRSVFVGSAERVIKPGQVQAYMNQICSNKKNQTRDEC